MNRKISFLLPASSVSQATVLCKSRWLVGFCILLQLLAPESLAWSSFKHHCHIAPFRASFVNTFLSMRRDTSSQYSTSVLSLQPSLPSITSLHRETAEEDPMNERRRKDNKTINASCSSRRNYLSGVVLGTVAGFGLVSQPASATSGATETATTTKVVSSTAVCDETVSVWKQNDKNRLVYLLGTAHISKLSAELAAHLVQDTHPNAVFVELDIKRVGGSMVSAATTNSDNDAPIRTSRLVIQSEDGRTSNLIIPKIDSSSLLLANTGSSSVSGSSSSKALLLPEEDYDDGDDNSTTKKKKKGGGLFGGAALRFGAAALGNAIRGMYSNLNQAGFNPGEEFISAIREGQKLGADIVLGDRDVEVTLTRLTQALAVTDLDKLLSPNSEFEKSMKELIPSSSSADEMLSSSPSGSNYNEELASFVENIKSRDKVRKIMAEFEQVAPALVQVMLTERNAYMAAGIDTLNGYEVMVAVMGLAHQDGVEQNLKDRGWAMVNPSCKAK